MELRGDVDLGDGQLQKKFEKYSDQISTVQGICRQLENPVERNRTLIDLAIIKKFLEEDLDIYMYIVYVIYMYVLLTLRMHIMILLFMFHL